MEILDAISPLDRVRLSGELAENVRSLEGELPALERVRIAGVVAKLLEQLGAGIKTAMRAIAFSLTDVAGSTQALEQYLDDGLEQLPEALVPFEAMTVSELASTVGSKTLDARANDIALEGVWGPKRDIANLAAYEEISARGVDAGIDAATVLRKEAEAKELLKQSAHDDPAMQAALVALKTLDDAMQAAVDLLNPKLRAAGRLVKDGGDDTELRQLQEEEADLWERYKKDRKPLKEEALAVARAFDEAKFKRSQAVFEDEGQAILTALREASPVTQEQAEAWAATQILDAKAVAKLERGGYSRESLLRDMADFYRLTGGKSSAVRISVDGGSRANAVGVSTRLGEKVVNVGSRFDRTVLFHELAHHLENDPIAKAAANGFLVRRREDGMAHSLRGLTDNKKYRKDEIAYKDSWLNPYIGKIYPDGITEVFSMGVQYLANPRDAALFAAKDPEMFALISGYLASELTPAMRAKLGLHTVAVDMLQERREEDGKLYVETVAILAKQVTLTADGWWDRLQAERAEDASHFGRYAFVRGKVPTYLGGWQDMHVFQGVFRNQNTQRNAKGYLVTTEDGARLYIPDFSAIHGDLELVKAFMVIAHTQGSSMRKTWQNVISTRFNKDPVKALLERAQSVLGAQQQ